MTSAESRLRAWVCRAITPYWLPDPSELGGPPEIVVEVAEGRGLLDRPAVANGCRRTSVGVGDGDHPEASSEAIGTRRLGCVENVSASRRVSSRFITCGACRQSRATNGRFRRTD